jgi:SAM-dependent methyltransferase
MAGLYDDAEVYDILHQPGTAAEAAGLVRIARRFLPRGTTPTFLEPACGSGRYVRALASLGYHAAGFDRNPAMIRFARRGAPAEAGFFVADMTRFVSRTPKTWCLFNPINSIRHLGSDRALRAHFDQSLRVLHPGGISVIGISLSWYGAEVPTEDVWTGARRATRISQVVSYFPPDQGRREHVVSHLTITRGGREEHRDSRYWLRTYDRAQWETAIRRAGLRTLGIVNEQGADDDPGRVGYALWVLTPQRSSD